jgi:hypothetical protein
MPKKKAEPSILWYANVELEVYDLGFAVEYDEQKIANRNVRVFRPSWLDGNNVMWDTGKRVRGWIKEQVKNIRPSYVDLIQHGIIVKSLPKEGLIKAGEKKDIVGDKDLKTFPLKEKENYLPPDGMDYPFMDTVVTESGSSVFSFYYRLPKAFKTGCEIFCNITKITPEGIENLMRELGPIYGIGDRRLGHFKVLKFDVTKKPLYF